MVSFGVAGIGFAASCVWTLRKWNEERILAEADLEPFRPMQFISRAVAEREVRRRLGYPPLVHSTVPGERQRVIEDVGVLLLSLLYRSLSFLYRSL